MTIRFAVYLGPKLFKLNMHNKTFVSVRELHREFLRSGADVMQALTFYASDDKLENRGNSARIMYTVCYILGPKFLIILR